MKPKFGLLAQIMMLLSLIAGIMFLLLAANIYLSGNQQITQLDRAINMFDSEKQQEEEFIKKSQEMKIQVLSSVMATIAPNPLIGYDFSTLELFVDTLIQDPEINFVAFLDVEGQPLASSKMVTGLELVNRNIVLGEEIIGSIQIGIDPNPVEERIQEVDLRISGFNQEAMNIIEKNRAIMLQMLAVVLGVVLLSLFIAALVARNILNPVKKLSEWASKVAEGDLAYENIPISSNEIGLMSAGFREVVRSFRSVANVCDAVAIGDLSQTVTIRSQKDRLGNSVNQMVENFRSVVTQANLVSNGDYTQEVSTRSEEDELGRALSHMTTMLRKMSEENKQSLAEAKILVEHLDNLPTPVFSIDTHFRITYINPIGANVVGESPNDCLGKNCYSLFKTPICQTSDCPLFQAMRSHQTITGETSIDPEQTAIPVKYTAAAIRDQNGEIIGGLEHFTDITEIKSALEKSQSQNELRQGLAKINDHMRGEQSVTILCQNLLSALADYIDMQVGAIYVMDEKATLTLMGSYAYAQPENLHQHFQIGEGLAGQAAFEKHPILVSELPDDYIHISSGLGESPPRHLMAVPLLFEDEVKGVLELGSFTEFSTVDQEFLSRLTESIAITINTAQSRTRLRELLEETRRQSGELLNQQEELQTANEELEERAVSLKESEKELQAQSEELRATNEELNEKTYRLEEQKSVLEQAKNELEMKAEELALASKYKSEFLANMSHELRTPLNSLLLLAENLASNKKGNLTKKQVEFSQTIHNSGVDLLTLINGVLDLAKIESGKQEVTVEELQLLDLTGYLQANFRPLIEEKGLTFSLSQDETLPPTIFTDPVKLRQILKNLYANAIKFTDTGEIACRIHRPDLEAGLSAWGLDPSHTIAFTVSDTGIGIPLEKQQLIFEAFQQIDGSTSRSYGGTGLGLSISKELAILLGGRLTLKSRVTEGSAFTLYLPETIDKASQPTSSVSKTHFPKDSEPKKITPTKQPTENRDTVKKVPPPSDRQSLLIVEDDPSFAAIVKDLAIQKGFDVMTAVDGETGLQLAMEKQPKAIVLDIMLPKMDGWAIMEKLKQAPATRNIPVHFISALDGQARALQMGALGFLHKPVTLEAMQEVFQKISTKIARSVKQILVVEKNTKSSKQVAKLIKSVGMHCTVASSGKKALSLLGKESFDCMVLDLDLKDMSGLDLLEQAESNEDVTLPPVIVYTEKAISTKEERLLNQYVQSIIFRDDRAKETVQERLTLFLHHIEEGSSHKLHNKGKPPYPPFDDGETLKDKTILIVDDDVRNTYVLTQMLEEGGMKVVPAFDGFEAVQYLTKNSEVDLILMDIMMPKMDGYETMKKIRNDKGMPNDIPIIALTAKAMLDDREKCLAAGANDYMAKPVEIARLFSLIQIWVQQ